MQRLAAYSSRLPGQRHAPRCHAPRPRQRRRTAHRDTGERDTHTETHGERERDGDRERGTETERERHTRHMDAQRERHRDTERNAETRRQTETIRELSTAAQHYHGVAPCASSVLLTRPFAHAPWIQCRCVSLCVAVCLCVFVSLGVSLCALSRRVRCQAPVARPPKRLSPDHLYGSIAYTHVRHAPINCSARAKKGSGGTQDGSAHPKMSAFAPKTQNHRRKWQHEPRLRLLRSRDSGLGSWV
eukprot:2242677-Rhodomonas_salina.1